MEPDVRLKQSPKRRDFPRAVTPEETLARVVPLAKEVGITRLSDITGLDRLGIPVWSSVVPKSNDLLSTYNGKGTTHAAAKIGAIMEAVERHAAFTFERPFRRASYASIAAHRRAVDPATVCLALLPGYTKHTELLWTEGHDLFSGEEVLVPADLAGYNNRWSDNSSSRVFAIASSNGLASGNTYEEAVAQALCEVVERDAWTVATILAHWVPRARFEAARAKDGLPKLDWTEQEQPFSDDGDRYPIIEPSTLDGAPRDVYAKFARAGLAPTLRDITSDLGVPTFLASVREQVSTDLPRAHIGLGTHPDSRVAVLRALTEAAQSRAVDIQGVREDMSTSAESTPKYMAHAQRVARINDKCWLYVQTSRRKSFADVRFVRATDTLDDIKWILDSLRRCDLPLAVEVELTNPSIGIPVTRVIVPGLESWAADRGRIGRRGAKYWNANRS